MLEARFRPLPKWTRKPDLEYRNAHFRTPYNKSLDLLEFEISKIRGGDVQIAAGFDSSAIRNDGWPRAGAHPSHPGVVLYIETADGKLCFPCGTYARMEDNIHAIVLTLACLRAVDRYGVTLGHEQYRGFLALPAPEPEMTVETAAIFLAAVAAVPKDDILGSVETYKLAYRKAAMILHPDQGGDPADWRTLQQVARIMKEKETSSSAETHR